MCKGERIIMLWVKIVLTVHLAIAIIGISSYSKYLQAYNEKIGKVVKSEIYSFAMVVDYLIHIFLLVAIWAGL